MIRVFHIQGSALRQGRLCSVDIHVEATDEHAALRKAVELMASYRVAPVELAAHRCGTKERELEEWVRDVFEKIRTEAKQKRGTG